MSAVIQHIEYFLPDSILTAEDLAREFPEWPAEKIQSKTGISTRHIAAPAVCASDLATVAAEKLFCATSVTRGEIDFILLCTQSPDYVLPATACILQDRLGLPNHVGAMDFNLGCSGFIYGLGLAAGLVETGQANLILLLTADTYSKYLQTEDKATRAIFGDGAAAILIRSVPSDGRSERSIFQYGTDGKGAPNLMVSAGGSRDAEPEGLAQSRCLMMNGPEIFAFTMRAVPHCIEQVLSKAGKVLAEIDLFVFHQANTFILEHLRRKIGIAPEKMFIWIEHCGNTVSSTIPIALYEAQRQGRLTNGMQVMLVGFGVGYSWGATILRWPQLSC